MHTQKITKDFYAYLNKAEFYSRTREQNGTDELIKEIEKDWKKRIEEALTIDFKKLLNNLDLHVRQDKHHFEIRDQESHGATTYKSFVTLMDNQDKMEVVVVLIINVDNSYIYLGQSHTHLEKYEGSSGCLRRLFEVLRKTEKLGSFRHSKFYYLDDSYATATNKMHMQYRAFTQRFKNILLNCFR